MSRTPDRFSRQLSPWILLVVFASGCLPRERFNKNCEWRNDSAVRLDVQNPKDQRHLIQDAQLAEELMIRYADFKHREPFGYEGHGGLLQGGKVGRDCLAKLDAIIETSHGVTHRQIVEGRQRRDWRFDSAVVLSFAVFYVFGAMWACRRLAHRFQQNGLSFSVVATGLCSVVASLAGVQLLGLWATTAEMLRVGNDHLGARRGDLIPWTHHFAALFACGVVVFLAAVLPSHRVASGERRSSGDDGDRAGIPLK
jgi:hypothetical protein